MSEAFLGALRAIYPDSRLLRQTAQLLSYESDALTAYRARPIAVVLPESAEEVIATVRACHRDGVPFVARGSGTSLSGGSLPIEGGILIGLNRLDRILELDSDERIAVVEPGVVNLKVSEAAAPYGLYYAPHQYPGLGATSLGTRGFTQQTDYVASTDGGRTWDETRVVATDPGMTVCNPAPVVDAHTGAIWLLLCKNPALGG